MDNMEYINAIEDHIEKEGESEANFRIFIMACDELKYPVFVVQNNYGPYMNPWHKTHHWMYDSVSDFYKSTALLLYAVRYYDAGEDELTWYLNNYDIRKGHFTVSTSNNASADRWTFDVMEDCILVHAKSTLIS